MPIITPVSLNSSASGWSVTPMPMSSRLIGPFRSSRIIQEKVRTRTEIQSGNSTP